MVAVYFCDMWYENEPLKKEEKKVDVDLCCAVCVCDDAVYRIERTFIHPASKQESPQILSATQKKNTNIKQQQQQQQH